MSSLASQPQIPDPTATFPLVAPSIEEVHQRYEEALKQREGHRGGRAAH